MNEKTDEELIAEAEARAAHFKKFNLMGRDQPSLLAIELAKRLKAAKEAVEVWKDEALKRETNCDCGYKD